MVDMNEVEALLDVITTLQIQMQAIIHAVRRNWCHERSGTGRCDFKTH